MADKEVVIGEAPAMCDVDVYQESWFGKVVTFDDILRNDEGFADAFSEGSSALKTLLLNLWRNGVETIGCCVGHASEYEFYKRTIFGKKAVDAKEYFEHCPSWRYSSVETAHAGYVCFVVPKSFAVELSKLRDCISTGLREANPQLPAFRMAAGYNHRHNCNTIGVYFDYMPRKEDVEGFFQGLDAVLCSTLGLKEMDIEPEVGADLCGDVDSLLGDANKRSEEYVKGLASDYAHERNYISREMTI